MTRGKPAPRWVIATGNPGKLIELRALLEPAGLALVAQSDLGVESPPETGTTFVENALIKARHAARQTALAAIADDSGLVVDALDGEPGIHSARYAGPESRDSDNVAKLLTAMRDVPPTARGAHFYCVIVALRSAEDPSPVIAQGRWGGQIAPEPVGAGGFGYDPVFFDPALGRTAAELTPEVKNGLSHRGRALAALAAGLAGTDMLG